jgi:cephalosporin hydroxylase
VLWFHWRARRLAWRTNDQFSVTSVTRPADMRVLLELTRGCNRVVELGTATAWTAITLALDDCQRRVVTYDVLERDEAKRYLELVGPDVKEQIELVIAPGSIGPRDQRPVDLLYVDSSHMREQTIAEVRAWQPHLRPGALVLFDDYAHPDYPGVREAIEELGLEGEQCGELFIHRHSDLIGKRDEPRAGRCLPGPCLSLKWDRQPDQLPLVANSELVADMGRVRTNSLDADL